jgi:hypothetical protein
MLDPKKENTSEEVVVGNGGVTLNTENTSEEVVAGNGGVTLNTENTNNGNEVTVTGAEEPAQN